MKMNPRSIYVSNLYHIFGKIEMKSSSYRHWLSCFWPCGFPVFISCCSLVETNFNFAQIWTYFVMAYVPSLPQEVISWYRCYLTWVHGENFIWGRFSWRNAVEIYTVMWVCNRYFFYCSQYLSLIHCISGCKINISTPSLRVIDLSYGVLFEVSWKI